MGRPRKNIQVPETALEAQVISPASTPPALPAPPPVILDAGHPRFDYKFLYPTGANTFGTKWEALFDELGKQGYLFIGESAGRSVFYKPIG